MLWVGAIALLTAAAVCAAWYLWFTSYNRRKSLEVLGWIDRSLAGHGHIVGVRWLQPSRFQVPVRMAASVFRDASVVVQIAPREKPLEWLLAWWRKQPETLTFQADLDLAPPFKLEVINHRCCARTTKVVGRKAESWRTERSRPLLLTTRREWQREITGMTGALAASRRAEFLRIGFRPTSPHLSATAPLESIVPGTDGRSQMFEAIRELAGTVASSQ